jgi:tagatose 6-phosphate kinase
LLTTVTLNPAVDRTYFLDDWRRGQVNRVRRKTVQPGGKGINVAQVARILGEQVSATGFLGAETEDFFRRSLLSVGVIPDFVPIRGEIRQNITLLGPHSEAQTEILEPGPEVSHSEVAVLEEKVAELARESMIVVISGSIPPGVDSGVYDRLIRRIREAGADAILDSVGEPFRLGCEGGPILVKPNRRELEVSVGRTLQTDADLIAAGRELLHWGAGMALISLGSEGSMLVTHGEVLRVYCPEVQPVNTVGCGDSLVAGVAVGLARGMDLPDCLRWGTAAASVNARCLGGGECDPMQVTRICHMIKVERIQA